MESRRLNVVHQCGHLHVCFRFVHRIALSVFKHIYFWKWLTWLIKSTIWSQKQTISRVELFLFFHRKIHYLQTWEKYPETSQIERFTLKNHRCHNYAIKLFKWKAKCLQHINEIHSSRSDRQIFTKQTTIISWLKEKHFRCISRHAMQTLSSPGLFLSSSSGRSNSSR